MRSRPRRATFRAQIDPLEDRCVLSAYNIPWPDPTHLSISFAPDGTSDAGQPSTLFQNMQSVGSTSSWENTIIRAFDTWSAVANISIGVKADSGAPFGTPGAIQGDSRFGDIRIGSISQDPGVLAVTQPFSYTGGTWAGDVNFSSADLLSLNAQANTEDLYTLALHEAGHSLGLADNNNPSSIMYTSYQGRTNGLSSGDIAAIQALYGARSADTELNASPAFPTWITPASSIGNLNAQNVMVNDSIASNSDQHNYAFTTNGWGTFNIDVTTSGFSTALTKITAYNAWGGVVGSAVATDPTSGNLVLSLPNLLPFSTYHFVVQSGSSDVTGIGNYSLRVLPSAIGVPSNASSDVYTNGYVNASTVNTSIFSATSMVSSLTSLGTSNYSYHGSVSPLNEAGYYRLVNTSSGSSVMTVSAESLDTTGLDPLLTVLDSSGHVIASQEIENQVGMEVLQIPSPTVGGSYFVRVASSVATGPGSSGNFALAVNFSSIVENQTQIGSGTLTPLISGTAVNSSQITTQSLTTNVNGVVHFGLNVSNGGVNQTEEIGLFILNANGQAIASLYVTANSLGSLQVWLDRGTYTIMMIGLQDGSSTQVPMTWNLYTEPLSNPMLSRGNPGGSSSPTTYPPGQQAPAAAAAS